MATKTIVFIHGLWMHASSWQPWMDFFQQHGYTTLNPGWPGDGATVAASRENPAPIANHTVTAIADSYADIFATLPEPPIVIGHSFGGLITQILLGEGDAAAGIAIDPAPIKGVWQMPLSAIKVLFPLLSNPFNLNKAVSLSFHQFKSAYANAIPEEEAKDLYDRMTIPSPARPLFQASAANMIGIGSETKVNIEPSSTRPLLITAGGKDNIVPPEISMDTLKKYDSSAVVNYKLFENRGHSLVVDHGWKEVAEYCLEWLGKYGF